MGEGIRIVRNLEDIYVNKINNAIVCFRGSYGSDPKYLLLSQHTYKLLLRKIKDASDKYICELKKYGNLEVIVTVREDIDFTLW